MPITIVNYSPGINFVKSVYLDANVLVFARDRRSPKYRVASLLLADLIMNRVDIFISDLVIDEFIWALLRAFFRHDTGNLLRPDILKRNPQIIANYKWRILSGVKKLMTFQRLHFASDLIGSRQLIKRSINLMNNQLLMPRDAFHLSFVLTLNIEGFVTSDNDFDNLSIRRNMTLYKY